MIYRPLQFSLRQLLGATAGVAVCVWIVASFDVELALFKWSELQHLNVAETIHHIPEIAIAKAVLLGIGLGTASLMVISAFAGKWMLR